MTPYNNRLLLIIFLSLIGVYVLAKVFYAPGREYNMTISPFKVDSASVTEVDIYPLKTGRKQIRILRHGMGKDLNGWQVEYAGHVAPPLTGAVGELLDVLASPPIQRLASTKKDRWDALRVGDTTGTHVMVFSDRTLIADLWVGAGTGSASNIYGNGLSYIRVTGHDDVYAADGFVSTIFDRSFGDWRNKTFMRFDLGDVRKIAISGAPGTPGASAAANFELERKDTIWTEGAEKASADSVNRYLTPLQDKNESNFDDDFHPTGEPDMSVVISNASGPVVTVKGWKKPDGNWTLGSSQRPDTYFSADDKEVGQGFLWNPASFIPKK